MKSTSTFVWDRPVRALHWALVFATATAWWTGSSTSLAHEILGYGCGAIVAARVAWGFRGSRYARFAQFVRGPADTWAYLRAVMAGHAPRHVGHNPLGAWMAVTLLGCIAALTVTGALYVTDWFWGYGWLAKLHVVLGWSLVALVPLHVAGVIVTGRRHGENLAAAMISGRKRSPAPGDID